MKARFELGQTVYAVTPDHDNGYLVEKPQVIDGIGLSIGGGIMYYFKDPKAPVELPEEFVFATKTELIRKIKAWLDSTQEVKDEESI